MRKSSTRSSRIVQLVICAALISLNIAFASGVQINQVLFAPSGADSGGEAVELFNSVDSEIDISGWKIRTESSDSDATIPQGTRLLPKQRYLVADVGWSDYRKSFGWRTADHEETLTISNEDAGIALIDRSENIVDAVGWGDSANIAEGLFQGDPAASNKGSLVRINSTKNNSADFLDAHPSFGAGTLVVVQKAKRVNSIERINVVDDSNEPGVQWLPFPARTRVMRVEASFSGSDPIARFNGVEYAFNTSANISFIEIPFESSTIPKNYDLVISVANVTQIVEVEVLPLKSVSVRSNTLKIGNAQATLVVENTGNIAGEVLLSSRGFSSGNVNVSPSVVEFSPDASHFFALAEEAQSSGLEVLPGNQASVHLRAAPSFSFTEVFTGSLVVGLQ